MTDIYNFAITAGGNNLTPPDGFPEFMDYAAVNDSARELMAAIARWRVANFSGITTAGTQPAYTMTSGQTFAAYADGMMFAFKAHADSTGAVTLNVDGKGAVPIVDSRGTAFGAGDIKNGGIYLVSKQGSNFRAIGATSGQVRTALAANVTYFVRADGSDTNTGLVNNAGGAFLTVQRAVNVVFDTLDLAGFNVDIQLADSLAYAGVQVDRPQTGRGLITIKGNAATPANVVLTTTGLGSVSGTVAARNGAQILIQDCEIRSVTSGNGLFTRNAGGIVFSNIRFGSCAEFHIAATEGGFILANGNYAIVGGAAVHMGANAGGEYSCQSRTVTLTGTPAFSAAFANSEFGGILIVNGNTYSGAATGKRFNVDQHSLIVAFGTINEFPGNVAGTMGNGSVYTALGGFGFGVETSLAGAATTDIGTIPSHSVLITGTPTIGSFGTSASTSNPFYLIKLFAGAVITNSANIFCPNNANYVCAVSVEMLLLEYVGSGVWVVRQVMRRNTTPTVQRSGVSGTYTPPNGITGIKVRLQGGGGGGGAANTNNGTGGGTSSMAGWSAVGGAGGIANGAGSVGGSGGANGTGTLIARVAGGGGGAGFNAGGGQSMGGYGGSNPLGSGGRSVAGTQAGDAGSGNGGGGGGGVNGPTNNAGGGGGAGEYVEFFMTAAQVGASQAFTIGGGGAGGTAGGQAGGAGIGGIITIEEFYT